MTNIRTRVDHLPRFRQERGAVPTGATDIATVKVYIKSIGVANTTGSPITFTVKDKQGTPRNLLPAVSIVANSYSLISFNEPEAMVGGITWQAGGAGLEASVEGHRAPV